MPSINAREILSIKMTRREKITSKEKCSNEIERVPTYVSIMYVRVTRSIPNQTLRLRLSQTRLPRKKGNEEYSVSRDTAELWQMGEIKRERLRHSFYNKGSEQHERWWSGEGGLTNDIISPREIIVRIQISLFR